MQDKAGLKFNRSLSPVYEYVIKFSEDSSVDSVIFESINMLNADLT